MAKPGEEKALTPKQVLAPAPEVQRACNDVLFALLFLVASGATVALALAYGGDVLDDDDNDAAIAHATTMLKEQHAKYKYALRLNAAIAGGALLSSMLWTLVMLLCGKILIWLCVLGVCALSLAAGVTSTLFLREQGDNLYWWPVAVTTLFVLLMLLYVCCIRKRIAFASANLQVACRAVLAHPVVLLVAVGFTLLQVIWALVWVVATYAAVNHGEYVGQDEPYNNGTKFAILTGMVLVFCWFTCVCRNVVMVATAGTVSSWWHHAASDRASLTTAGALCRALTLSFGSICFGSLLVSIIQTVRFVLASVQHALRQQGNAVAACLVGCLGCLVACVQKWVEYFNRFAYAYVGIYGYNFVGSGRRVWQLFAAKGWTTIMNDSLIANVLFFGKVGIGFLGAAAGWGCVAYGDSKWTSSVEYPEAALGISGFLVGFSVADVVMTVVDGAVATVFVLFAEDPHALSSTHSHDHNALHSTWQEIYPEEFKSAVVGTTGKGGGHESV